MVKILFCATWPKISTGYAKIANLLSNRLAEYDDTEVHYLAFQAIDDDLDRYIHPNITFIKNEKFGDDVLEEIITKTVKPDVVILYNDVIVGSRFVNKMLSFEKNFKFIMYIDLTYKWQRFIDHIMKKVDMFVCFHKTWMNHMIEMGVPAHRVTYLEHPVDKHFTVTDITEAKEFWKFNKDDFVVLNMNRNSYRKCLDITMDGFIQFWKRNNYNTRIKIFFGCKSQAYAGAYDPLELAISFGKINNLPPDKIKLLINECVFAPGNDHISDDKMNYLYNACDVGINTCCGEGFGLCNTEHQMVGKPQIVTNLDNFKEIFSDEWCKMLEPKARIYNTKELDIVGGLLEFPIAADVADALDFYYKNPEIRKQHGEKGMKILRERFIHW